MHNVVKITGLHIYPVKSCRGIELQEAMLIDTGLEYDRQWMVVDTESCFLSQRVLPKMALIHTSLTKTHLRLSAVDRPILEIPIEQRFQPMAVRVWDDACAGYDVGDVAATWLSEFLGRPVRLVRYDSAFQRLSDRRYTGDVAARNAYSDGFPILLASQASLDDLNDKLKVSVPMNRFRPNIVVDGAGPFEEDYIAQLSRPGLRLKPVKLCTRCPITTTDQDTAMVGVEPLLTLASYRNNGHNDAITFGQNVVILEGVGERLLVGDELTVEWNF